MKAKQAIGLTLTVIAAAGAGWFSASVLSKHKPSAVKVAESEASKQKSAKPGEVVVQDSQLTALKTETLKAWPKSVTDSLNGKIVYDEDRTARVETPVAGRVTRILADIGDTVAKGQALAELDSPDFASAQADFQKATADQTMKELAWHRAQTLLQHEVIAARDAEAAKADYLQAQAETTRAREKVRNLHGLMISGTPGQFRLVSPLSGRLAARQVNPGMEAKPDSGSALFIVTDPTKLWVLVDVPEADIGKVFVGQHATVEVQAYPGKLFDATVTRVGLAVDPDTRRIPVRCALNNTDLSLKPDMFAKVAFSDREATQIVRVPNQSLLTDGLYSSVFVQTGSNTFRKLKVQLLRRGADFSEVSEGLKPGDNLVVEGALLLNSEAANDAQ